MTNPTIGRFLSGRPRTVEEIDALHKSSHKRLMAEMAAATDPVAEAVEAGGAVEQLLTPADVAKLLGVGVRTLERWRQTGDGPRFIQLTRKTVRYRQEAVGAFIQGNEKSNTAQ